MFKLICKYCNEEVTSIPPHIMDLHSKSIKEYIEDFPTEYGECQKCHNKINETRCFIDPYTSKIYHSIDPHPEDDFLTQMKCGPVYFS